jgi:hypothetical protein
MAAVVATTLERGNGPLEAIAGRVLRAGVVVVVDRAADTGLAVRRRLVDRRRHGAGQLVRLLPGMDGQRLDRQLGAQLLGSHRPGSWQTGAPPQ